MNPGAIPGFIMFTVKHYKRDGTMAVSACDSYERKENKLTLFSRGIGNTEVEVAPDEAMFIENVVGKTITAIRSQGGSDGA